MEKLVVCTCHRIKIGSQDNFQDNFFLRNWSPVFREDLFLYKSSLADGLPDIVPAVDANSVSLEELRDGDLQGDGVTLHGLVHQVLQDQFKDYL